MVNRKDMDFEMQMNALGQNSYYYDEELEDEELEEELHNAKIKEELAMIERFEKRDLAAGIPLYTPPVDELPLYIPEVTVDRVRTNEQIRADIKEILDSTDPIEGVSRKDWEESLFRDSKRNQIEVRLDKERNLEIDERLAKGEKNFLQELLDRDKEVLKKELAEELAEETTTVGPVKTTVVPVKTTVWDRSKIMKRAAQIAKKWMVVDGNINPYRFYIGKAIKESWKIEKEEYKANNGGELPKLKKRSFKKRKYREYDRKVIAKTAWKIARKTVKTGIIATPILQEAYKIVLKPYLINYK